MNEGFSLTWCLSNLREVRALLPMSLLLTDSPSTLIRFRSIMNLGYRAIHCYKAVDYSLFRDYHKAYFCISIESQVRVIQADWTCWFYCWNPGNLRNIFSGLSRFYTRRRLFLSTICFSLDSIWVPLQAVSRNSPSYGLMNHGTAFNFLAQWNSDSYTAHTLFCCKKTELKNSFLKLGAHKSFYPWIHWLYWSDCGFE